MENIIEVGQTLILTKAILAFIIGFVLSIICGLIFIPILKKLKIGQTVNVFVKKHKEKEGTPTMGGIIFIIPTILSILILLLTNRLEYTWNLGIILFVFIAYAILGFIDDYLIIKNGKNEGLTQFQKLFGQILIAVVFFLIFHFSGHELYISILRTEFALGNLMFFVILFYLVAASNAVNITDGLDGLAGGLSAIAFLALGLIAWAADLQGATDIGVFCFILVGSLIGFLFFNCHPARIFMGDTGSLSLGATLAAVALVSGYEITFIVLSGVFIIETLTCIIQLLSIKFTGRKVFLMSPLHHHFEKIGYKETDIVKSFWVVGILLATLTIFFGVWM